MQILMYIHIGHNTTAVWIILQIIDYTVNLIHHTFLVLMLHTKLISVRFANRTILICPAVPDMRMQIMDIVRLLLPDPEHLIRTALNRSSSKCQRRKFLRQIITVHHSKLLNRISTGAIFPHRTHLFTFRTGAVVNNVTAHIYKHSISITHVSMSSLNINITFEAKAPTMMPADRFTLHTPTGILIIVT